MVLHLVRKVPELTYEYDIVARHKVTREEYSYRGRRDYAFGLKSLKRKIRMTLRKKKMEVVRYERIVKVELMSHIIGKAA